MEIAQLTQIDMSTDAHQVSAYTDALPIHPSIVAIDQVDVAGSSLFSDWIEALFKSEEVAYKFRPAGEIADKIKHLYFKKANQKIDNQPKNIGFGYPILIRKNSRATNGMSAIPLFIWDAYLQPDEEHAALWTLQTTAQKGYLNPQLKNISTEVAALAEKCEGTLRNAIVTGYLCSEFAIQLSDTLQLMPINPTYGTEAFPSLDDLMNVPGKGQIIWSGVLSDFPKIAESKYREEILTKDYWASKGPIQRNSAYQLDNLINDHYQKGVQRAFSKHRYLAIEAPMGTGKTHVLVNILSENLMNGRTTLIVGSHQGYLDKLIARLGSAGLQSYAYCFSDLEKDKKRFTDLALPKYKTIRQLTKRPSNSQYENKYLQFAERSNALNQVGRYFSKNVFDINNRAETIGLFLKNNRQVSKDLLERHLKASDFRFNRMEYAQILSKLEGCNGLFKEAFSFKHPLSNLSDEVFLYDKKEEAKATLDQYFKQFLQRARAIQKEVILKMGAYNEQLSLHFKEYENDTQNRINELGISIDEFEKNFAGNYTSNTVGNLKFRGNFSEKPKAALPGKLQAIVLFDQLKEAFSKQPYFDFTFKPLSKEGNLNQMRAQLKQFGIAFNAWRETYPFDLKESAKHLSSKSAHSGLSYKEKLETLETDIDNLVADINKIPLFKEGVQNNGMTLPLKLKQLEKLIEHLNYGYYHMRDYEEYFDWRRHWQEMNPLEKKVLDAVLAVRPDNWTEAFKSWYFQNLMAQETQLPETEHDVLLEEYLTSYDTLRAELPSFMRTSWAAHSWDVLQDQGVEQEVGTQMVNSKNSVAAFQQFYQDQLSLIKRLFPIQLMTQSTFETLYKNKKQESWDSLIILGASNFTNAAGGSMLSVGKEVGVFSTGNKGNVEVFNSFWETSKKLADRLLFLKMQHQVNPLPLLHFTNAVYRHYLQLPNLKPESDPALQIIHTKGQYKEAAKTNKVEAMQLIDSLATIYGASDNTPRVGIACATFQQKDLIAAQLLKIQQLGATNSDILADLTKKGLGVYTFDELVGQSFDVLLVSLTYGIVNADKEITEEVEIFNTTYGYHLVQSLLTCDTRAMHVYSSFYIIPPNLHQSEKEGTGLFIFYNFLEYLVANQNTNRSKLNKILDRLSDNPIGRPIEGSSKAFNEEVASYLKEYILPERIVTNIRIGNHLYPIMVKPTLKRKRTYILLVDNYVKDAETFSFVWQRQQQHELEKQGYHFIQIWSDDWWTNPKEEARQLAGKIIADDNDFS